MSKNINCAVYARISTSDKNQSTEMQIHELLEFTKQKGLPVFRIYEDKGFSGSSSNRPMLKELMQDVRIGKVTHVLCWRLDRWFRSLKEVVLTLNEFNERKVVFISLKDGIDLSSSTGRLMANLLACFAQFEIEVIRERVKSGLENARRNGRVGGRRRRIDQAKVIEYRSQGMSLSEIGKIMGATAGAISKTLKKSQFKTG